MSKQDFHHPYQPYGIQYDLMRAIYQCIEDGKVGIFESPTGTGKSLSLICGSLTWLRDFQARQSGGKSTDWTHDDTEPSWLTEQLSGQKEEIAKGDKLERERRLRHVRDERRKATDREKTTIHVRKKTKVHPTEPALVTQDDAAFELDDYESDSNIIQSKSCIANSGLSAANLQLMQKLGMNTEDTREDGLLLEDETKVFFCSRTHSQLSQFVHELKKPKLPAPPWSSALGNVLDDEIPIKHLPLGSRKNLCINPSVSSLGTAQAISDRCLDLQQAKGEKKNRCSFLPNESNKKNVEDFGDQVMSGISDIEDIAKMGKTLGICPYYASRSIIRPSEIVTLPYPLLLQKTAREAVDISLKGHIVIVDEAHNLMDTISQLHSSSITSKQVKTARSCLTLYLQKFRTRLKGKNRVYVAQLLRVLDSISACLDCHATATRGLDGQISTTALLSGKGCDQVNMFKLIQYLQASKLARKVEGFIEREETIASNEPTTGIRRDKCFNQVQTPVLTQIQTFLLTLTNPAAEGRFFYESVDDDVVLKYLLLDPTFHFKEVVEEARAVILAGGTMSPMEDYSHHLFPYVYPDRLMTWSCGHIVPKENLLAIGIDKAANGTPLRFDYDNRSTASLIESLGDSIVKALTVIPDGVAVFFPSYGYMEQVMTRWRKSSGASTSIWDQISANKEIFQEDKATSAEQTLLQYSTAVAQSKGAIIFCVINGKLSEGINFSDELGRAVMIVGLPFPNAQSAQWKAKMEYIEGSTLQRTGSKNDCKEACRKYYENVCMRAVNQSIGRAIRHRGDFACIMLFDERYQGRRIQGKLPEWIRQSMDGAYAQDNFEQSLVRIRDFFKGR